MFELDKCMCDWFYENGVKILGIDYDYTKDPKGVSLQGVYAEIKEGGRVDFMLWDDDGNGYEVEGYEGMSGEDGVFLAKSIEKLMGVLKKPYPTNHE